MTKRQIVGRRPAALVAAAAVLALAGCGGTAATTPGKSTGKVADIT